jgi:hypothetical protein
LTILLSLALLFCGYRRWCKSSRDDSRGEYRAVAAHYTADAFDDTFDDEDNLSDYYDDDEEDGERGGWSTSVNGKRVIEMKEIGKEDLSLEEMNG